MSKLEKNLINLILSLSKAEKRSFRELSTKKIRHEPTLVVQLFDHILKHGQLDEKILLLNNPSIKKSQLSNLKQKLYKNLLYNLRHLQRQYDEEIQVRELLDYANVLYSKGLYNASLDQLDKAKTMARKLHSDTLMYSCIELQRKVENQYIFNNSKSNQILQEKHSMDALSSIQNTNAFANFSRLLYSIYLKNGYVKNEAEYQSLKLVFDKNHPVVDINSMSFYDKIYMYQSYVWYYNMIQDFPMYYRYSQKWILLCESQEQFIKRDLNLYIKGLHNCLNALYTAFKFERFQLYFEKYLSIEAEYNEYLNPNTTKTYRLFKKLHELNQILLSAKFTQSLGDLERIILDPQFELHHYDQGRTLTYYYKIACIYFGAQDYDNTILYLNKIIDQPIKSIRLDIHCFARILSLIAHFELGNEILVSYQVRSVYRFLSKLKNLQSVQLEIFTFLRRTTSMKRNTLKSEFINLRNKLERFNELPFEKRPFLYLDILGWLDSKIQNKPIELIIRERSHTISS